MANAPAVFPDLGLRDQSPHQQAAIEAEKLRAMDAIRARFAHLPPEQRAQAEKIFHQIVGMHYIIVDPASTAQQRDWMRTLQDHAHETRGWISSVLGLDDNKFTRVQGKIETIVKAMGAGVAEALEPLGIQADLRTSGRISPRREQLDHVRALEAAYRAIEVRESVAATFAPATAPAEQKELGWISSVLLGIRAFFTYISGMGRQGEDLWKTYDRLYAEQLGRPQTVADSDFERQRNILLQTRAQLEKLEIGEGENRRPLGTHFAQLMTGLESDGRVARPNPMLLDVRTSRDRDMMLRFSRAHGDAFPDAATQLARATDGNAGEVIAATAIVGVVGAKYVIPAALAPLRWVGAGLVRTAPRVAGAAPASRLLSWKTARGVVGRAAVLGAGIGTYEYLGEVRRINGLIESGEVGFEHREALLQGAKILTLGHADPTSIFYILTPEKLGIFQQQAFEAYYKAQDPAVRLLIKQHLLGGQEMEEFVKRLDQIRTMSISRLVDGHDLSKYAIDAEAYARHALDPRQPLPSSWIGILPYSRKPADEAFSRDIQAAIAARLETGAQADDPAARGILAIYAEQYKVLQPLDEMREFRAYIFRHRQGISAPLFGSLSAEKQTELDAIIRFLGASSRGVAPEILGNLNAIVSASPALTEHLTKFREARARTEYPLKTFEDFLRAENAKLQAGKRDDLLVKLEDVHKRQMVNSHLVADLFDMGATYETLFARSLLAGSSFEGFNRDLQAVITQNAATMKIDGNGTWNARWENARIPSGLFGATGQVPTQYIQYPDAAAIARHTARREAVGTIGAQIDAYAKYAHRMQYLVHFEKGIVEGLVRDPVHIIEALSPDHITAALEHNGVFKKWLAENGQYSEAQVKAYLEANRTAGRAPGTDEKLLTPELQGVMQAYLQALSGSDTMRTAYREQYTQLAARLTPIRDLLKPFSANPDQERISALAIGHVFMVPDLAMIADTDKLDPKVLKLIELAQKVQYTYRAAYPGNDPQVTTDGTLTEQQQAFFKELAEFTKVFKAEYMASLVSEVRTHRRPLTPQRAALEAPIIDTGERAVVQPASLAMERVDGVKLAAALVESGPALDVQTLSLADLVARPAFATAQAPVRRTGIVGTQVAAVGTIFGSRS